MKILVVTSPLTKIFQQGYHPQLIKNPTLLDNNDIEIDGFKQAAKIVVPRSAGEIIFTIGVPLAIGGPRGTDKDQDTLYLGEWLSGGTDGGQNQETDAYGVADMGLDEWAANSLLEHLMAAAMAGKKANLNSLSADIKDRVSNGLDKAKEISHNRVMKEIRRVNAEMENLRTRLETDGKKYTPSTAEWLCRYVLRIEVDEQEKERSRLQEMIEQPLTTNPMGVQPNV